MFKLNTARTYKYPVTIVVYDELGKEQKGSFTAIFKVLTTSAAIAAAGTDTSLLDLVLVGVEGVEAVGADGNLLQGDALLAALKDDPSSSAAIVAAYLDSTGKKNRGKT